MPERPLLTVLPGCLVALALLAGCATKSATTVTSQEVVQAAPPPPSPAPPAPSPPPPEPPKRKEVVSQAVTPPAEDPLAWASVLSDVHFDFDKAEIRDTDKAVLGTVAERLKEDGRRKVLVEGHCDDRGTEAYNLALGERRAKAVQEYLANLGAASSQIEITSYGKERPLCTEATKACRRSNRRAHFLAQ